MGLCDDTMLLQVFSEQNGFQYVEEHASKLGMHQGLVRQLSLVLKNIKDLLAGVQVATVLGETCGSKLPAQLPSGEALAELLYAYLVQWLGKWVAQ